MDSIEYALMVDWEDGQRPEFIPATDAHHAEEMARKLYQGRSTWTVQREVKPWCYAGSIGAEVDLTPSPVKCTCGAGAVRGSHRVGCDLVIAALRGITVR